MPHRKRKLIESAFAKVIRPFVKLMLSHGITFREFSQISKEVFFEAGREISRHHDAKSTASQLSILTGLHRKDISSFLMQDKAGDALGLRKPLPAGAAIVAKWSTHSEYIDAKGKPKMLPYTATHEKTSTFVGLVESVTKDVRPRAYLDELLRLGIVGENDSSELYLKTDSFVPNSGFAEKMDMLVKNVGDHIKASVENVQNDPPPFFERSAFHSGLSNSDMHMLKEILTTEGMDFLRKIYKRADELAEQEAAGNEDKNKRMTIGFYMYHEDKKDA